jgi:hypothetical protein
VIYETTFQYRLSGRELDSAETVPLTVSVDSFHRVEVTSDAFEPILQKQITGVPPVVL